MRRLPFHIEFPLVVALGIVGVPLLLGGMLFVFAWCIEFISSWPWPDLEAVGAE